MLTAFPNIRSYCTRTPSRYVEGYILKSVASDEVSRLIHIVECPTAAWLNEPEAPCNSWKLGSSTDRPRPIGVCRLCRCDYLPR
jgi:hypothetical protein